MALCGFETEEKDDQGKAKATYDQVMQQKVQEVLNFLDLEENKRLKERVHDISVPVTLDQTAASAYDEMLKEDVYLGIVSNEKGAPTHFTTTGDVRRVLLPVA